MAHSQSSSPSTATGSEETGGDGDGALQDPTGAGRATRKTGVVVTVPHTPEQQQEIAAVLAFGYRAISTEEGMAPRSERERFMRHFANADALSPPPDKHKMASLSFAAQKHYDDQYKKYLRIRQTDWLTPFERA